MSQVGFRLQPKQAPTTAGEVWHLRVRIDSPSWSQSYELPLDVTTVATDANFHQTFRSPDDNSVQFYGVRPPQDFLAQKTYAMVLSLHGARVAALGQVSARSRARWSPEAPHYSSLISTLPAPALAPPVLLGLAPLLYDPPPPPLVCPE